MIIHKTWGRTKHIKGSAGLKGTDIYLEYLYSGWFLFGIIPIYIDRKLESVS